MAAFIVYRKEQAPGGNVFSIRYLKKFDNGRPVFTGVVGEAKRVGFLGALFYRALFLFSIQPLG